MPRLIPGSRFIDRSGIPLNPLANALCRAESATKA
jgi:hypothetical protein